MRLNTIASALFWFWGVLVLLVGFAIGYPAFAMHEDIAPLLLFAIWGVSFCLGGFALRRRRWGVRWWGSFLCIISAGALLLAQVKLSLLGVAINLAALGLVLGSWQLPARVQP